MPYIGNSPGTGTRNRFIFTATASQTTFSGSDDNGKTLAYSDGDYVDVYLNGICLVPVDDYAATSKTSIVLTVGAAASDTLEVVAYDIATIADTVSKANGGNFDAGINVDGNVGIGTTLPSTDLEVFTASSGDQPLLSLHQDDNTPGNEWGIDFKRLTDSSSGDTVARINAARFGGDANGLTFYVNNSGGTLAEAMRISSGKVLQVNNENSGTFEDAGYGPLQLGHTGKSSTILQMLSSVSGYTTIHFGDGTSGNTRYRGYVSYDHTNEMMDFGVSGSEKARIIQEGALQVSDTGSYRNWSSNITGNQFIRGDAGQVVLTADATSTGYTNDVMRSMCNRGSSSSYEFFTCTSGNLGDDEFRLRGDGQAYADGSWNGGGADYAEYFEWSDGNTSDEDRVGFTVVLDGNKVRKATSSDNASNILGAVSANPSVVGDTDIGAWKHKYLRDDFGRYIRDTHNVVEWTETVVEEDGQEREIKHSYEDWNIPDGIIVPEDATISAQDAKRQTVDEITKALNPDYDPDLCLCQP